MIMVSLQQLRVWEMGKSCQFLEISPTKSLSTPRNLVLYVGQTHTGYRYPGDKRD